MWKLIQRFAAGSLLAGAVASLLFPFLHRDESYAFWQLLWGYIAISCVMGLLFGGMLRILRHRQDNPSAAEMTSALLAGAITLLVEFLGSTVTGSVWFGRILSLAGPPIAAVVFVLRIRRLCSRSDCPAAVGNQV
jgi:peptidoglycan/LPS O-acetylase OafA/YrhL